MNKSFKSLIFGLIALVFVFIIFFVMKSQNHDNSTNSDSLIVGVSPDYPPFEFTENGKIVGFDIDFAHELGKVLNKKIELKEMEFSSLIPALNSRKVDMIISSVSKNSERAKNISFSIPYYTSAFAIITKKENDVKSIDDFKNSKIGVQTGSTMESFINHYNDFPVGSFGLGLVNVSMKGLCKSLTLTPNDSSIS